MRYRTLDHSDRPTIVVGREVSDRVLDAIYEMLHLKPSKKSERLIPIG